VVDQIVANGLFSSDKLAAIIAETRTRWIIAASIKTARRASI
jgi:hypothetical protein